MAKKKVTKKPENKAVTNKPANKAEKPAVKKVNVVNGRVTILMGGEAHVIGAAKGAELVKRGVAKYK